MYKKKELQLSYFSICEGKKLDDKIVTYFALKAGSTVYIRTDRITLPCSLANAGKNALLYWVSYALRASFTRKHYLYSSKVHDNMTPLVK